MRRILCALTLLALTAATPAAAARIDPALAAALAEAPPGARLRVEVVLAGGDALGSPGATRRAQVAALQDAVLAALPPGSWEPIHRFESIAALAGRASAGAVAALAAHPGVLRVSLDGVVRAGLAEGKALIGADSVHAGGTTGQGVTVAVLDTGVDTDHPDLADALVDEQCFCLGCCPGGSASAEDDEGHGTNVAGIVSSAGAVADTGVAHDAALIAVKVLDSSGGGNFSDTAAGLDWLLTNHTGGGPLVVNLSLGDGGEYASATPGNACGSSPTQAAIAALHAAGVPVLVASGNDGHDDGISFPACVPEAISVGGVYDADVGEASWCGPLPLCILLPTCTDSTTGPDVFVCHTNDGPNLDVLAPNYQTRTSAMGGGIQNFFAGTSASAPYAAGQLALLLETDPTLTPEELRTLLRDFGPLVTNPDNGQSYPRTDIHAAVSSLPEPGGLVGLLAAVSGLAALTRRRPPSPDPTFPTERTGSRDPAANSSGPRAAFGPG